MTKWQAATAKNMFGIIRDIDAKAVRDAVFVVYLGISTSKKWVSWSRVC